MVAAIEDGRDSASRGRAVQNEISREVLQGNLIGDLDDLVDQVAADFLALLLQVIVQCHSVCFYAGT